MAPADDTRGIVDPQAMLDVVDFARVEPGDVLEGLVEWFWSVAWSLPAGEHRDQEVLNHPAGNISIGTIDDAGVPLDPPEGRVYGVLDGVSHRHLAGAGWTVAARTTVGGLGAFLGRPARSAHRRQLTLGEAVPGIDLAVVDRVGALGDNEHRTVALRECLEAVVGQRDPDLLAEARQVAGVARRAEHDRDIRRVEDLAEAASVTTRTLQRWFDTHVGVSPSFVIRRWRLIDAVEAAGKAASTADAWPGWASVAAELGYADQAHLTRDFQRHLGVTPSAYLARNQAN